MVSADTAADGLTTTMKLCTERPFPARNVVGAFQRLEQELLGFLDQVPLVPEHEHVWSPVLASIIVEACGQLDSFWKASSSDDALQVSRSPNRQAVKYTHKKLKDHFRRFGHLVASEWIVVWSGDEAKRVPFCAWEPGIGFTPLPWWAAHNALKHERWPNIKQATLRHAVDAVGALFLAIARSKDCFAAMADRGWIYSNFAVPWLQQSLENGKALSASMGVTVESSLFSYAAGSRDDAEFRRWLAAFHRCSRRFGRWLEHRFEREFMLG